MLRVTMVVATKGNQLRTIILPFWLLLAQPLWAEVSEELNYTYYVAHSDRSSSLKSILDASSPVRENGQVYHAYTAWNISWNFQWFENPDGTCSITLVTTKLSGSITLPKLEGATSPQRNQFDRYLKSLRVHELGHYDIGRDAALAIDRKILSLPEMLSCKALASAANDIGYGTLAEYKARDDQYDTSTSHGKAQGAWLDN